MTSKQSGGACLAMGARMTIKGAVTTGDHYSLAVSSPPATPLTGRQYCVGATGWQPADHACRPRDSTRNGFDGHRHRSLGTDPRHQFDLPDPPEASSLGVHIESGPNGVVPTVWDENLTADDSWTFLVQS